jgi:serine/threonine protein kinase
MPADPQQVKSLFLAAAQKPAGERAAFLDAACGQDAELRARVERLLQAHDQGGSLLDQPAPATVDLPTPLAEVGGARIGPYKLLQQIGEGGMGTVWMAEQTEPVQRLVALKLIKAGLDSAQVLARFEQERQAIALMDHPHIARVLDAGTTDSGRPYFVMEPVKGIPITKYCDEQQLTPRQRLELVVPVCQAIQHAHQKGIIHRDIKPSNVLVASYDGKAVPKVIDFGVAKATGQKLTERTLFAGFGGIVGTLEYMSPEQAEFNALDIDTRADIYSLGVLLYELLTGTTPLSRQRLKQAALAEALRLIREEEPPRPSTRLSESRDALPSVAAQRRTEPAKLAKLVRGEVDWLVMKALDKDRNRRYETANGLAQDIQRYLADEPVLAGPPSASYRLRKFAKRHKGTLAAAALVVLALAAGMVGTTWGLIEARRQEDSALAAAEKEKSARAAEAAQKQKAQDNAQQAQVEKTRAQQAAREAQAAEAKAQKRLAQVEKANAILGSIFQDLDPRAVEKTGQPLQALLGERLDKATAELEDEAVGDALAVANLQMTLGQSQLGLGYAEKAVTLLSRARATYTTHQGADHPDTLRSMAILAAAYDDAGKLELGLALHEQTLKLTKAKWGADDPRTLVSMNNLALAYQHAGKRDLALPLHEETLRLQKAKLGADHRTTLLSMNNLALAYQDAGKVELAVPMFAEALQRMKAQLGAEHPDTLTTMLNLALGYQAAGKHDLALPLLEEALQRSKARLGTNHPETLRGMNGLAYAYQVAGKLKLALPLYEEVLQLRKAKLGADHPLTITSMNNLGTAYLAVGELKLALPLLEETFRLSKGKLGADHPDTLSTMNNLAKAYEDARKLELALPLYEESLRLCQARLGAEHDTTLSTMNNLASAYQAAGKLELALAILEKTHP